jgi:hypothetical protein
MDWAVRLTSAARLTRRVLFFFALFLISEVACALDDAEGLSWKVPGQAYRAFDNFGLLEKANIEWGIPFWSCIPANLKIIKVLGKSPPAPYAVEITVGRNGRIDARDNVMRLQSIHLLAASLEDAVKIRRALIAEIESMRKVIEKRQGNPPGYLKRVLESQSR